MTRLAGIAAAFLLLSTPALPAEPQLKWNFADPTYVEVKHVVRQKIKAAGKERENVSILRFLFKFEPSKVGAKETVLDATILEVDDTSKVDGQIDPDDDLKGFRNQKFKVTLGANCETLAINVNRRLVESAFGDEYRLGDADEKKLCTELASIILRTHLMDVFTPMPANAVSSGNKWKNATSISLQSIMEVRLDREYTLAARKPGDLAGVETITWTSGMEFKTSDKPGLFPFTIKEAKPLKDAKYEGTILWDTAAGRPRSVEALMDYDLEFTIEIEGKSFKGSGSGKDTYSIKFFDKNPDAK